MQSVATFELVSRARFVADYREVFGGDEAQASEAYDALKLPVRATTGSAGYDFFTPAPLTLSPGQTVKVPTGVRARIDAGWLLAIFPRSGLGFKFRLQLDNTVGIIDSDYYNSANEGHIFVKITNDTKEDKTITLARGAGFAQGVFLPFGVTTDDDARGVRDGGFGSTGA